MPSSPSRVAHPKVGGSKASVNVRRTGLDSHRLIVTPPSSSARLGHAKSSTKGKPIGGRAPPPPPERRVGMSV